MKFMLVIRTDNDAFQPNAGAELARILEKIADDITHASNGELWAYRTIRDADGHDVGRYALKPDEYR